MTSTQPTSGPELLDERSLGGILVHFLGLLTGFVGPAIVYVASTHEYTRMNARRALNWHATVFALLVVTIVTFILGADDLTIGGDPVDVSHTIGSLLPPAIETVFGVIGIVLLIALAVASFLTLVYTIVATVKAIFGSVWTYPGSVNVVSRLR